MSWDVFDSPPIQRPQLSQSDVCEHRFPLEGSIAAAHERKYSDGPYELYGRVSPETKARKWRADALATVAAFYQERKNNG